MGATLQTDVYFIERAKPTPDTMYEFVGMNAEGCVVRVNYEKPYGKEQSPEDVLSFLNRHTAERFMRYLKAQSIIEEGFYVSKQSRDADVYYRDFDGHQIHIGITRFESQFNYLGSKPKDESNN